MLAKLSQASEVCKGYVGILPLVGMAGGLVTEAADVASQLDADIQHLEVHAVYFRLGCLPDVSHRVVFHVHGKGDDPGVRERVTVSEREILIHVSDADVVCSKGLRVLFDVLCERGPVRNFRLVRVYRRCTLGKQDLTL